MMFDDCSNLTTIIIGDGWSTDKVNHSTSMFSDCTNLVGGEGTTYDASKDDKTYAIVDGGSSAPGYLTKRKNITSIAIATLPTKTEYNIGESLDLTGGQLEVTFDDNSKKTYDLAIAEITGFNSQNVAELTLEVKYSGQKTTFAVTIIDPKTPVAKIPVDQNIAKVWSSNRTIFIETQPDTKYTIIDINGRLITTSTTKSTREEIQVNYNGVLVVIIGNNSYKVLN